MALSNVFGVPGVTRHPALWSADFPRWGKEPHRARLTGLKLIHNTINAVEHWTKCDPSGKMGIRNRFYGFSEEKLANIKSAIKRNKQNQKKRVLNRVFRGRARTYVQKARAVIDAGNVEDAKAATQAAISALDKAAEKGIIHKNNAARRKSRLMKHLAALG